MSWSERWHQSAESCGGRHPYLFAGRAAAHVEVLETIDAAMLIAGLALAGSALPVIPLKKQR
jgi:hypothetical protein